MTQRKPLSIYIHIPFCVSKCFYCDFLSFPAEADVRERYIEQLLLEIETKGRQHRMDVVETVFLGGGTPSILTAGQIEKILWQLSSAFEGYQPKEVTIEINPGTVSEEKLTAYRKAGINRLSIGLQSADNNELKRLGRIHTFEEFLETYDAARKVGFDNINVDIMSALPGQTIEIYHKTLEKVSALEPEHISAYSLIIEEGTPFCEKAVKEALPDEDTDRLMYEMTEEMLQKKGYHRYEISNYAKSGRECLHNCVYWERGNYLGFGLGAASLYDNVRWNNTSDLEAMLKGEVLKENVQCLSVQEQMEEFMFLGLRLMHGISPEDFYETFGQDIFKIYNSVIPRLVQEGLLQTQGRIALTKRGIDISNYVLAQFLFS